MVEISWTSENLLVVRDVQPNTSLLSAVYIFNHHPLLLVGINPSSAAMLTLFGLVTCPWSRNISWNNMCESHSGEFAIYSLLKINLNLPRMRVTVSTTFFLIYFATNVKQGNPSNVITLAIAFIRRRRNVKLMAREG